MQTLTSQELNQVNGGVITVPLALQRLPSALGLGSVDVRTFPGPLSLVVNPGSNLHSFARIEGIGGFGGITGREDC